MQRGEWITIALVVIVSAVLVVDRLGDILRPKEPDPGIPFYSHATTDLKQSAGMLIDDYECKRCHSLWGRSMMQMAENVPAPRLDGIGSLHSEEWFYRYLSAKNPQAIIPSRLKIQYRMPSYAFLSDRDRHTLAAYLSSLKVAKWYLEQTKKDEYEALTGKTYPGSKEQAAE